MPAIQSPGLGSGLDVNSIVSQLMALESRPLTQLDRKEAGYYAQISGYGSLKGALSSLQSSLGKLQQQETFQSTAAVSSDKEVFSVSADLDAVPSAYDVTVERLAQRHKLGSREFAGGETIGGGAGDQLTLTVGSENIVLDLSTAQTLEQIQSSINLSGNDTGVTAGIITGDNGKQTLVFTAEETGFDNRVQLSYGGSIDASSFAFATVNRDAEGALLASDQELDSALVVDGVNVTRGSNTISDVVSGLTFSLKGEGRASATISKDSAGVKGAVTGFIKAYNSLAATLSSLSETGLSGNSILLSVGSQVRGVLNQAASGLGAFTHIQTLGVTTNEDGALQLDSEMLDAALAADRDSLAAFFADEDNGFATRLDSVLDGFLQSGGMVDSKIDGAGDRIKDIEKSREALQSRLEVTEQRLRKQFTALDGLVSQLTTTSNFLTRQLAVLPDLFSNRK